MQLTIKATGENVKVISHLLAKNPANIYERKNRALHSPILWNRNQIQMILDNKNSRTLK
jgi:hypothetical protein